MSMACWLWHKWKIVGFNHVVFNDTKRPATYIKYRCDCGALRTEEQNRHWTAKELGIEKES